MKNTLLILSLLLTIACNKESTEATVRPTYAWQIGEASSIYTLKFKANSNEKYTLAIVNEDLCANKNIHFLIIQNKKIIEEKDLSELIYTKVLDIKINDAVEITTTLIDTKKSVTCKKMGNVKINLK